MTVKLFRGEESHIQTISGSAIDDGEWHSWTEPASSKDGMGYRFEIAKKGDGDVKASSHYLQIGSRLEWLVPSIEQKPFNGDDHARQHYFPYGANPTLCWRTIGELAGKLRLELMLNGSTVSTLSASPINDGGWHSWTVPHSLEPSSNYQFKLVSNTRSEVEAVSQRFHLGAIVDIALPMDDDFNPQTTIRFGDQPNILWRSDNITGQLKLELFHRDAKRLTKKCERHQ